MRARQTTIDTSNILVYGEMYESAFPGTSYTMTVANTYYQWASTTGGEVSGTGWLTYDSTNKRLVVGNSGAGKYRINFDVNGLADWEGAFTFALFKNGTQITKSNVYRALGRAGDMLPAAVTTIAGTYVEGNLNSILTEDYSLTNGANSAKYAYVVSEVSKPTGFCVQFDFANAEKSQKLGFVGNYNGHTGDNVIFQARDYTITASKVLHGGTTYTCFRDHTSGASTEPGVGADWQSYWIVLGTGGDTWATSTAYVAGWVNMTSNARDLPQETPSAMNIKEFSFTWSNNYFDANRTVSVRAIHTSTGSNAGNAFLCDRIYLVREHIAFSATKEIITSLVANDYIELWMANTTAGTHVETRSVNIVMQKMD